MGRHHQSDGSCDREHRRCHDGRGISKRRPLHALVQRELDRHRGRCVHTTGDGLLATFDGPARAIRCACAIRDGVRSLGVEVRAGLHTGEVELAQDDVRGIAVHTAARVMERAGAGAVLVSRTVTDLVAGSDLTFEKSGEFELRGIPGQWALFAVTPMTDVPATT